MSNKEKFLVFTDESGFFSERYQAISAISGEKHHIEMLKVILHDILRENKENENGVAS
jgi:hypothetical protein